MRLIGVEYEAAMRGRATALVFSVTLLGFAGGIGIRARGAGQVHASDQPRSEQERAWLVAAGKELFMARCARCHDERGDKPLKTGPGLNERGLSSEQIARAVSGRLRDKTEEERRAVTLYISSWIGRPARPFLIIGAGLRSISYNSARRVVLVSQFSDPLSKTDWS